MARGLSPKLPVSTDPIDGYALNKTYSEVVTQNLKNLILTAPGERIMDVNFGVGIRNYLFEQNIDVTHTEILLRIREQVSKYMPFLEVQTLLLSPDSDSLMDPNLLKIEIRYFIKSLQAVDVLEILVDNTN